VHLSPGGSVYPKLRVYGPVVQVDPTGSRAARGKVERSGATSTRQEQGCAAQLAKFFPQVLAIRVPVQVTALRGGGMKLREAAILEFGSREFAIFLSTLPLEFDDRVRLERDRKGRSADAVVIAVQYHEECKAVAVRFTNGTHDWVMQTP
jgi:hypothetical protein